MPNKWIEFVKQWSSNNKLKYGDALRDQKCKEEYHKSKQPKEDVKTEVTQPEEPVTQPEEPVTQPEEPEEPEEKPKKVKKEKKKRKTKKNKVVFK